jgi:hypothetical protein
MKAVPIALAVLAYTLLAIGLVLMKRGIGWLGHKGRKDAAWRKDLGLWIAGFLLSNSYIVPVTMALRALPPHVVAAFAGWGVVVMIALSRLWLGEKLRPSDMGYAAAMVFAIALLSLYEKPGAARPADPSWLAAATAFPFLFLPAAFSRIVGRRGRAFLFAAISGISTGLIVVFMKILVQAYGGRVAAYFRSPHLYLYLVFSLLAFISLQLAYKLDTLLWTGPVQYSAAIIYPALCSALVFGNPIRPVQISAILAVVLAVAGMLTNRGTIEPAPPARKMQSAG